MAEHAAVDVQWLGKKEPFLMTFGAPRVGDDRWASRVNDLIHYRVVNHRDPIVHYPGCKWYPWKKGGRCLKRDNEPYHSGK